MDRKAVSDQENRWDNIGIFDMFDDGEYLWFTSIEYNALFKMSKRTFQADYVGSFPDEEMYGYRLYTTINEWNGKLFFTPCSACEIGVYDMKNKHFEKINIGIVRSDNDFLKAKYAKKFVSGFLYNNTLILIPCCYDNIIVYDIITGEVSSQKGLFAHFYAKYKDDTTSLDAQFYFCWFARRVGESEIVFHLHCNRNILVFYNLATGDFREQAIGSGKETFSLIECDGRWVYLYDIGGDVLVKWEMETGQYSECHFADKLPGFQACGFEGSFVNMKIFGEWLYLIPANTNAAVKVHRETLEVAEVDALSEECFLQDKGVSYLHLCRVFDNELYLLANRSKELLVYGEDGGLQHIKIKVPEEIENVIAENYLAYLMRINCCRFSEEQTPLTRFINALTRLETGTYENRTEDDKVTVKNCGSDIYTFMKQDML